MMWFTLNWSPVLFGLAAVLFIIALFARYFTPALILGALTLFLGTHWVVGGTWAWVPTLVFVVAITVATLAYFFGSARGHSGISAGGLVSAIVAFGIALALAVSGMSHVNMPWDEAIDKAQTEMTLAHAAMDKDIQDVKDQLADLKTVPASFEAWCAGNPAYGPLCDEIKALKAKDIEHDKAIAALQEADDRIWQAFVDQGLTPLPGDVETDEVAEMLLNGFYDAGFQVGSIAVGNKVDCSMLGANQRGSAPFRQKTLCTLKDYIASLKDPHGADQITMHSPKELHPTFLAGKWTIPVQFLVPTCVKGNWGLVSGKPKAFDKNCHEAGDMWWVPIDFTHKVIYIEAAKRAACANGAMDSIAPVGKPLPVKMVFRPRKTCQETGTCPPPPPTNCPTGTFWSDKWKECLESKLAGTPTGSLAPSPTTPHETVAPSPVPTPATTATPTVPAGGASPTPTPTASVPGGTATPSAGTPIPTPTG